MAHKESGTLKERLIFFPLWVMPDAKFKYWTEDMGPVDAEFSEGAYLDLERISISCSLTHPEDMRHFLTLVVYRLILRRHARINYLVPSRLLYLPQPLSLRRHVRREGPNTIQLHLPPLPRSLFWCLSLGFLLTGPRWHTVERRYCARDLRKHLVLLRMVASK